MARKSLHVWVESTDMACMSALHNMVEQAWSQVLKKLIIFLSFVGVMNSAGSGNAYNFSWAPQMWSCDWSMAFNAFAHTGITGGRRGLSGSMNLSCPAEPVTLFLLDPATNKTSVCAPQKIKYFLQPCDIDYSCWNEGSGGKHSLSKSCMGIVIEPRAGAYSKVNGSSTSVGTLPPQCWKHHDRPSMSYSRHGWLHASYPHLYVPWRPWGMVAWHHQWSHNHGGYLVQKALGHPASKKSCATHGTDVKTPI